MGASGNNAADAPSSSARQRGNAWPALPEKEDNMRKSTKPHITVKCVANNYAASNQRIVEFSDGLGKGNGGLISIRQDDQGKLIVNLDRLEGCVSPEAAAHELLAALKRALNANDNPGKDYDWTTEAETAIAKAEGK
jgi:hypothetical protein